MKTYRLTVAMTSCHSFTLGGLSKEALSSLVKQYILRGAIELRIRKEEASK